MSWGGLFSKRNEKKQDAGRMQGPTSLQQQRAKQIGRLRLFHQRVTEVQRDVQYKVTFQIAGEDAALTVFLPDGFPNEKPLITVSPKMQHPWVDEKMYVVGCTALNNFYMHSDLGKVLQIIIKEFQENPPFIFKGQTPTTSVRSETSTYSIASSTFYTPVTNQLTVPNGPLISVESDPIESPKPVRSTQNEKAIKYITDPSDIIKRLKAMSLQELQELNDNPEALINEIRTMSFINDLKEKRDQLCAENEELARFNIALKPELETGKELLGQVYDKHVKLKKEFHILLQKQLENREIFDLNSIITNLSIGAMQAEEASEEVAEEFLNGERGIDEFLKEFLEKRKTCHMRKAKEEKARGTLQ